MCEGTIHILHKDFGSSVFAVPGKCSKSGNTYFAAVPATEHIHVLEKFTCVCRYAATYDFLMYVCIYRQTQKCSAACSSVCVAERIPKTRTITFRQVWFLPTLRCRFW